MDKVRFHATLSKEALRILDYKAKKLGLSRSAYLSMLILGGK